MQTNAHNKAIPEREIADMNKVLSAQLEALSPYATPLTSEDRHNLVKMGPKTFEFVELAHTLAEQNPNLTSKYFDMEAFTVDWEDAHNLLGLVNKARQLAETLEDIRMTAGSDAIRRGLEFYADVKSEAARNVPEARTVYEQLKASYPHGRYRRPQADGTETGKA